MSETVGVNVTKRAMNLEVSPQFDGYSAVRIYVGTDEDGNDIIYEAGNTTGRVLEIQNDFGTQAMANNILADIRGYQYQPLQADSALLNPAAEMGDGVTVNGVYTGIFVRETAFGKLMASNIKAPTDEEIAHEYSTESATTDRAFSRFVHSTRASLALTSTEIDAEVSRATTAEETLRASLTLTADKIDAEVTRAKDAESQLSARITIKATEISAQVTEVDGRKLDHTHKNNSFGWKLTSTSFAINSGGGTNVFYADKNGVKIRGNAEVTGKITATSGYIGNGSQGFTIRASAITNGKSSLNDNYQGVYIGTDGIALGRNFKVDTSGNVTATSMTAENIKLSGRLQIGDSFIDADTLRQGAEYSWDGHEYWDGTGQTVDEGAGYWDTTYGTVFPEEYGGAERWDDAANAATSALEKWEDAGNYAIGAGTIYVTDLIVSGGGSLTSYNSTSLGGDFYYGGYSVDWIRIVDGDGDEHIVLAYY